MRTDPRGDEHILELWGGAECTVNRVGTQAFDQIERTRHPGHIALADIDFHAMRVPVLWERVTPSLQATPDWAWSDRELAVLRTLGIRPIVGLLHHGCGPVGTDLLDPAFPLAFAAHARAVATRYPWVRDWTPVNEPLTTARFSGLYGHWHPHRQDNESFLRCLLQQLQASVLAMCEIRRVIPRARFVHTEDLGRATGSPRMAYQATFENERRWLSADLLCGIASEGVRAARASVPALADTFDWLLRNASPPDVIGINHYVTSNRHLDDRVALFADAAVGDNGRDRYVDVEAVRVRGIACAGFEELLLEAWQRLQRPLALTEVHMQGSVHEQRRWLEAAWHGALRARARGVPVCGVTAWGLFGHVDWHNLVTRADNIYAAGVFDTRTTPPSATPLLPVLQGLAASGHAAAAAATEAPGWWTLDHRYSYCIAPATPASPSRFP